MNRKHIFFEKFTTRKNISTYYILGLSVIAYNVDCSENATHMIKQSEDP